MLSAERIALLKHGAPPRNALEAALRNVWYGGGGASYEKTVGPAPIISISDAKPKPAKSLIVGMEPIQDLHGYDNPWLAGGGANKWDGTFNTLIPLEIASGTTACLQCVLNDTSKYITLRTYDSDQTFLQSMITATVSGNINYGVLTLTSDAAYIRVEKSSDVTVTNGMLSIGNNTPQTYSPYSNECPISGRTGVTVERTGKNLLEPSNVKNLYVGGGTGFAIGNDGVLVCFRAKKGETYTISGTRGTRNGLYKTTLMPNELESGKSVDSKVLHSNPPITFTADEDVTYAYYANDIWNESIAESYWIELGSTATDYEPYVGTSYPVVFPDGQTVYGGTVDVVTGVLTVDRYYFKGGWTQYNSSNGFRAYRSAVVPYAKYLADVDNKPMSNTIGKFGSFSSSAMTENIIQPPRNNSSNAYMALDENVSPDDVDLCYLVAEPQTYQLTPTQIQLLKGSNTLWSDADDLTLTYIGTTPPNLLGGMLGGGIGNPQETIEETSEEPTEGEDE